MIIVPIEQAGLVMIDVYKYMPQVNVGGSDVYTMIPTQNGKQLS